MKTCAGEKKLRNRGFDNGKPVVRDLNKIWITEIRILRGVDGCRKLDRICSADVGAADVATDKVVGCGHNWWWRLNESPRKLLGGQQGTSQSWEATQEMERPLKSEQAMKKNNMPPSEEEEK